MSLERKEGGVIKTVYWGVKERRGALHLLEKIPIEKVYFKNLACTVWWVLFPQGHSTRWFVQIVSTQREVIMEREGGRCDGEGRGMCHERKSRRCPQEEGGRCRGEGRMKLELS